MKEFKQTIVNAIVDKARSERVISLYETAKAMGYRHISTIDCMDIMNAVKKALPNYRAVKMVTHSQERNPATAGLFTTLTFVENGTEFDNGAEF